MSNHLSQETIDALRAVSQAIAIDEGKSFDMDSFYCGTTLCIAGHLMLLKGFQPCPSDDEAALFTNGSECIDVEDGVTKYYGKLPSENGFGNDWWELYSVEAWPYELEDMYDSGRRVEAAQLAIEWFIAQHSEAAHPTPASV